jgi:tRNA modification GTPase
MTTKLLLEKAQLVQGRIAELLQTAQQGKVLREGLATAIVGRPNVGKSSLLNHLLHEDKAIVTDVAGTTRDVLEEYVNVRGVPLKLVDTAGIHETDDKVEKIGVARSRAAIIKADLILLVLDQSEPLTVEDRELLEATADKKRIIILNKTDLTNQIDRAELLTLVSESELIQTSILTSDGVTDLENKIAKLFFGGIENSQSTVMITNARQIGLLNQAQQSLTEVISGIAAGMPVDLVQIDMTNCWDQLGEITGDSAPDELITELFSQFCLGK